MTASGGAGALRGWKKSRHDLGDKYEMRIDEVTNPLKTFLAQIRAQGLTARTTIQVESLPQARAILAHVYGLKNVQMVIDLRPSEPELMGGVGRLSGPSAIGVMVPPR